MLSQYPGTGHCTVAEDAQFHHQVLQSFSKKGSAEEMLASWMQILVMGWSGFGSLRNNLKMRIQTYNVTHQVYVAKRKGSTKLQHLDD